MSRSEANRERRVSLEHRFDHEEWSSRQNLAHKTRSRVELGKAT